jgi:hypothetical protein
MLRPGFQRRLARPGTRRAGTPMRPAGRAH